jgi:cytoskeletal protein CcmA (bactofilin family)
MTLADGVLTVAGEVDATSLDVSGDIDVDGTANLDVVDVDGAVDMASTLTVAGVVDITDTTDASDATGDTGALRTEGGASIAKKLYVGTDLDVDGTANLDNTDIDGTLNTSGVVTSQTSANISQVAISSSSNATAWDAAAAANAYYSTSENTTISAPSNAVEGAIISIEIAQGGTARTVAWNTVFEFAASTAPTVTATANKTDIFAFRYNGSVWQEIGRTQNMAQT